MSRIFRRSAAQPSASIYTSNASLTSTVSNVITISTSTAAQQRPSNSTNSTLISDKAPNGPFIKDVIILGGPDYENVPLQGARSWFMENGHVVAAVIFI